MKDFTLKKLKNDWMLALAICFAVLAFLPGCKKTQYPLVSLNQTLNVTSYLEANPSQFSLFDQILQRTGYDGFLNAYGSFTVFFPYKTSFYPFLKKKKCSK